MVYGFLNSEDASHLVIYIKFEIKYTDFYFSENLTPFIEYIGFRLYEKRILPCKFISV